MDMPFARRNGRKKDERLYDYFFGFDKCRVFAAVSCERPVESDIAICALDSGHAAAYDTGPTVGQPVQCFESGSR